MSESDVHRCQILTSKVDPRAKRVNEFWANVLCCGCIRSFADIHSGLNHICYVIAHINVESENRGCIRSFADIHPGLNHICYVIAHINVESENRGCIRSFADIHPGLNYICYVIVHINVESENLVSYYTKYKHKSVK